MEIVVSLFTFWMLPRRVSKKATAQADVCARYLANQHVFYARLFKIVFKMTVFLLTMKKEYRSAHTCPDRYCLFSVRDTT